MNDKKKLLTCNGRGSSEKEVRQAGRDRNAERGPDEARQDCLLFCFVCLFLCYSFVLRFVFFLSRLASRRVPDLRHGLRRDVGHVVAEREGKVQRGLGRGRREPANVLPDVGQT